VRLTRPAAIVVAVFTLSVVVVATSVSRHEPLFVYDEVTYADYLIKIDHGTLWMPQGDEYAQETMRVTSCRGVALPDENAAPLIPAAGCDQRFRPPAEFVTGDVSNGGGHPPTYFLITYVGARTLLATGLADDLVTAGRLFGAVWMAAGLLGLIVLARSFGAPALVVLLLVLLVAFSPRFIEEWQYLTPDAANLVVGSGVMLLALRWLRGDRGRWCLPLAGVLGVVVKAPNILVVGACCLAILVADNSFRPRKERIRGVVTLAGSSLAAMVVLAAVMALRSDNGGPSVLEEAQRVSSLRWWHFTGNLTAFLGPLSRDPGAVQLSYLVVLLFGAFLVLASFAEVGTDIRKPFSAGLLVFLVVGPGLLILLVFVVNHQYFPIENRYGYSLVPGSLAIGGTYWDSRLRLGLVSLVLVPYIAMTGTSLVTG
jgi:hypothetical protein